MLPLKQESRTVMCNFSHAIPNTKDLFPKVAEYLNTEDCLGMIHSDMVTFHPELFKQMNHSELRLAEIVLPAFTQKNYSPKQMLNLFFDFNLNSMSIFKYEFCNSNQRSYAIVKKAIDTSDLELMKFAIQKGADLNHVEYGKDAFIYQAVNEGCYEIVEHLLKCGANPNATANNTYYRSQSALHQAAIIKEDIKLVKLLIQYGADTEWEKDSLIQKINSTMQSKPSQRPNTCYFYGPPEEIITNRLKIIEILKSSHP